MRKTINLEPALAGGAVTYSRIRVYGELDAEMTSHTSRIVDRLFRSRWMNLKLIVSDTRMDDAVVFTNVLCENPGWCMYTTQQLKNKPTTLCKPGMMRVLGEVPARMWVRKEETCRPTP